jgi:hypothetical protein
MHACASLVHLLYTELTQSKIFLLTESMLSESLHKLSQCRMRRHVNWANVECAYIYEITSLCIESVDVKSRPALIQLRK